MQRKKRLLVLLAIAVPALAVDRITKYWAANWLVVQNGGAADFWPGVFGWVYAENTGMAFSALSDSTALLTAFSFALVIGITAYILLARQLPTSALIGLSMVAAGGAGNLWDRLFYGYVVDFIHLEFMRFAIFNVADIFVCCGATLVVLVLLLGDIRTAKEARR